MQTIDIKEAARRAVHSLSNQFDLDRDGEPYFSARRRADGTAVLEHSIKELGVCHVAGRGLLALRMAELHLGVEIPDSAFATYARHCRHTFANPIGLNAWDVQPDGSIGFEMHNIREGLYGLWAVISRDGAEWAVRDVDRALTRLVGITAADGLWDQALMLDAGMNASGVIVDNQLRAVDPLLDLFALTGAERAIDLARRYVLAGSRRLFLEDGRFAPMPRSSGHIHSMTSALSGITRYAVLAGDRDLVELCVRALQVGVPEWFSSWGWGDEVMSTHEANVVSQGEVNQTGDVVRAACALGLAGHAEMFELAERFTRGTLLTTQFSADELRTIVVPGEVTSDATRDVISRIHGGYGFPRPDTKFRDGEFPIETIDITSGALHALAVVQASILTPDDRTVNMLFDSASPELTFTSHLPHEGQLDISVTTPGPVAIRLPPWVNLSTHAYRDDLRKHHIVVHPEVGSPTSIHIPLHGRHTRERVDGVTYDVVWRGGAPSSVTQHS